MKNVLLLFTVILTFSVIGHSQTEFQRFLAHVDSLAPAQKSGAVDSFLAYAGGKGIPFIEGTTATFLYRGNNGTAALSGDMNSWATNVMMSKLTGTNLFYYSHQYETDARLDYKFILDGSNWILDPRNPHQIGGGFGPNSELAMPGFVQPWEISYRGSTRHGGLASRAIHSVNVGKNYAVQIYLPAGYDTSKRYPAVYFHDGSDYLNLCSARNILDNLIDSNIIAPVIGVFVTPNDRNNEYAGSLRNAYTAFFAAELVPFIDSLYATERNPAKRLTLGDSYGGNISALICYYHPEVFGNCGLQSGAFQEYNYEADTLWYHATPNNVKFASCWGTYEPLWGDMRRFRDKLQATGHHVFWKELPQGHSWGQWRVTLQPMLHDIFPPLSENVMAERDMRPSGFFLEQNYPNPFNPTTDVGYRMSDFGYVTLKIFDVLGQAIATLLHDVKAPGEYHVGWNASGMPSGIYFYRLDATSIVDPTRHVSETRKMILTK